MNTLYLLLNLGSVSVPFLYSFHPRLQLHKRFLWIFISILITMGIFIPWDVIFTLHGIWGFNDTYFLGLKRRTFTKINRVIATAEKLKI
ncbi:lycopene cyclase domain-containing protein [Flavobacteriaceae bacterium]|nr:lycopene cyclase domain-containing protein [Flavobacteriaceae bacterium]